ncbi:cellulose synthase/poly-beta-1,6-N-acetylglucosamine synthase-like glycosyltransferase [Chitinophaga niastensis]|uniref:Cellulose synthase/poly-beta-1,6-N-acetylglucosamine synthase-like glycosyltransferase n=1 Tax=Chitinophaga niastensis TaxID=536980 RepID=A0A2P8HCA1_CHINA|nr:glycosyltransferase family 2 protein [Chitinophaga niastensis]PSL43741.1 cellulose synthase/poly-beta-1,6-N-acetylglucosamine synthase-like glycosyltransferase [Chitinophaga niastensis]
MIAALEIIVFAYLAFCVLYNLIFSVAGKLSFNKGKNYHTTKVFSRIAILIPAYKEDDIIISAVKSYEQLEYPEDLYDVVVIADSLQPATIKDLKVHRNVIVIPVSFEKSTKARSLNTAFAQLDDVYDIAVIADADNILEADFLLKVNHAYVTEGKHAMQAQRVAKNLDTPFAIMDAANEIIANHINRKGANALGLSASLIGSGIAFHYPLIKQALKETAAIGGFDKVLQQLLVYKGYTIHYLEDALIFDEKVENAAAFENQRKRWLSSQFVYLKKYFNKGCRALLKGRVDYFYMAVGQNMLLPRMLLLAGLIFMTAIYLIFGGILWISVYMWLLLSLGYAISLLLPLPGKFYSKYFFKILLHLPGAIGIMLSLVFKLKGANKTFIHTKHSKTDIDNPLINVARK